MKEENTALTEKDFMEFLSAIGEERWKILLAHAEKNKKIIMIAEMTAEELNANCRTYVALKAKDMTAARAILERKYSRVETDENGFVRIYDEVKAEEAASHLYRNGIVVTEITTEKIGLEEYYIDLMANREGR